MLGFFEFLQGVLISTSHKLIETQFCLIHCFILSFLRSHPHGKEIELEVEDIKETNWGFSQFNLQQM